MENLGPEIPEQLPEGYAPEDIAKVEYMYTPEGDDEIGAGVSIAYRDCQMVLIWDDSEQGDKDVRTLIHSLPGILKAAKQERLVREQTRSLEGELAEFLGDE